MIIHFNIVLTPILVSWLNFINQKDILKTALSCLFSSLFPPQNIAAVAVETEITFPQVEQVKISRTLWFQNKCAQLFLVVIQSKYFCASANDPCPRLQGCSLKFSLVAEFIQLWPFYQIVFHMSLSKGKLFVNIVRYKFLLVFCIFCRFLIDF